MASPRGPDRLEGAQVSGWVPLHVGWGCRCVHPSLRLHCALARKSNTACVRGLGTGSCQGSDAQVVQEALGDQTQRTGDFRGTRTPILGAVFLPALFKHPVIGGARLWGPGLVTLVPTCHCIMLLGTMRQHTVTVSDLHACKRNVTSEPISDASCQDWHLTLALGQNHVLNWTLPFTVPFTWVPRAPPRRLRRKVRK